MPISTAPAGTNGDPTRPALRGRAPELAHLDGVLRDVRSGRSRVLVVRGEAGVGKTALLDHLVAEASRCRVVRAAGVEAESEVAYAVLQQVCAPLLGHLDALPEPQREALSTAFGLGAGAPPPQLVIGLAVLGLLAEAAQEHPLVCVVDDVQWLDRMSEVVLTFVARRLEAESVALVFGARSPDDGGMLADLPELRVTGLAAAEARALLDAVLPGPLDDAVRDRIVAETGGNPLALLELPRDLSPAELAFGLGANDGTSVASRVEDGFAARIAGLPDDTRRLLLAAALDPVGDVTVLWRAAERLGVAPDAATPAQTAGLVDVGARVRFRHPLVRSAAWRSAGPDELRTVHRALADVTDPDHEPDRRAWHLAHAAAGPDEAVAAELERSADRALARGGRVAAATFLERAAELTAEPKVRGARVLAAAEARFQAGSLREVAELLAAAELAPLAPAQRAGLERLRAQAAFAADPGRASGPALLAAARRLEELDVAAARETYLTALGAALHAGRSADDEGATVARAALALPPGDDATGLLLTGLATWFLEGHAASVAPLRRALGAITEEDAARLLWLAGPLSHEVGDEGLWWRLTELAVRGARTSGEVASLPNALTFRAVALAWAGRTGEVAALNAEAESYARATGRPLHPAGPLVLVAYEADERAAAQLQDSVLRDADARGQGRLVGLAHYSKALLLNGLGRYPGALEAAREGARFDDLAFVTWTLVELAEAAARTGDRATALEARDRLAARAAAVGTDWLGGLAASAYALTASDRDAEAHYREAVERLSTPPLVLQRARVQLQYGEWLRRQGQRVAAREQLRTSQETFAGAGAHAFADRAARELAATGETVRKRTSGADEDLTAQEAQIARLAVAGRTNPEIGAVLFLSPRTVEWHLRKVFAKLGVSSRRELAGALTR